ncbi:MAG: hypothetical protein GY809_17475 [Planctomycetes bacterium]|nr:hypothetical protein [Planctomycetota bacterium]
MCDRTTLWIACGMMCLAFMVQTAPGQVVNLALNASMEKDESLTDEPGWGTWYAVEGRGSEATFDESEFIDGARSLRIDPIGTADFHFNVVHQRIPLEVGKTYTASFWAKAEEERTMTVRWKAGNNSVTWGDTQFDLTTEWAEYALTSEAQYFNGKLGFLCAGHQATIWLDFVWAYEGEYAGGILPSDMPRPKATKPSPSDGATDVAQGVVLAWAPGVTAATRDLYVGESFEVVDAATVPTASGLDVNSFDLGRLDLGQTVFWRVDEVNGTPDKTVHEGDVWRFEVEPYAIRLASNTMTVTASSVDNGTTIPRFTINGSGLDHPNEESALHSNEVVNVMWMSAEDDPCPWLMYEFDLIQKLDQMLIWNSNHALEAVMGCGIKDMNIKVSLDGIHWTSIFETADGPPFTQGSGVAPLETQTIDMGLVAARYVKIRILDNWSRLRQQCAVAEVQFYAIPVQAQEPKPESGSVDILFNTEVSWRAGRDAAQHIVYIGTELDAVAEGSALSVTTKTNSLDMTSLDLHVGQTYYWRVDEVNEADASTVWTGPVWRFETPAAISVEDFECFDNVSPNRPYQTWLDGTGYSADEFFPVLYGGNGTGATIGHDIWGPNSLYRDGDIMEEDITMDGSTQSMPFYYSNSTTTASAEATVNVANLQVGQDWSKHGIGTLTLHFRADSVSEALDTTLSFTGGGEADWFSQGGDTGWFSQTAVSYDGSDAAQSRDIWADQVSSMQTTVSGAGTVSFYRKISSEWWDVLRFYIDGDLQGELRGEITENWHQVSYVIADPGLHALEWRYIKDGSLNLGDDCAWIDRLEWDGEGQPATMPEGNTGQLYVKVNGVRVDYPGTVADLKWAKWKIDLASLGVDLQNVTTLTIGIEGDDAKGTLYLDNFRLEPGE